MRRIFSRREFIAEGHTKKELEWALKVGRIHRVAHGWYLEGGAEPTAFERQLGRMLAADGMATSLVAGRMLGLDGIELRDNDTPRLRCTPVCPEPIRVDGVWCTDALQTLVDIAPLVDDLVFEQALECALHKKLLDIEQLTDALPLLAAVRAPGTARIKRVLALRPKGAPPTESLLETLMVQLARQVEDVPEPDRHVVVNNEDGRFVARVDLAWCAIGAFNELDGQGHKDQPVYDAVRQTNVVIATGWLCGRFTWREVRHNPIPTGRRLRAFMASARRRGRGAA
ncbi:MAG TPA: hypothetical protein VHC63_02105 [Acidimicrobiales bacterium]|nr:hypothetical protein [Acidimicrobiales bacterium]